jgi:glycosyltransferase involved in cell wall biosynthesis
MRVMRLLLRQRIMENQVIVHVGLLCFMLRGYLYALLMRRSKAVSALSRVHRSTRLATLRTFVEPYIVANMDVAYNVPVVTGNAHISGEFGQRVAVLKEPGPGSEKGVVFVMFSETLRLLCAAMDMHTLLRDYTVVVEPSWSGYCEEDFLRCTQFGEAIFVLAAQKDDFAFLERLESNLIPVDLGPCDWVDPRVAEPYLNNAKEFDIVMNSNWGLLKRHHVLFRILNSAKRRYTVALIGRSEGGRKVADIEQMATFYGVHDQLTIFDDVPYPMVMDITCRGRVSVLLSLKEGSNRAIAESMFCNVPVVVVATHIGGIVKNVVPETGVLAPESELEVAIRTVSESGLNPRRWAIQHISCFQSADRLNNVLRDHAIRNDLPWTHDIAIRSNSPSSKYVWKADEERLSLWNHGLSQYLRS